VRQCGEVFVSSLGWTATRAPSQLWQSVHVMDWWLLPVQAARNNCIVMCKVSATQQSARPHPCCSVCMSDCCNFCTFIYASVLCLLDVRTLQAATVPGECVCVCVCMVYVSVISNLTLQSLYNILLLFYAKSAASNF